MKRSIAKGTPEQLLNLVQNKIAELGGDVEACDNITAASYTIYQDTNGIMGEIGDTWTVSELRQYWDAEQMNDPVLSEYDSFESWLEDTTRQMTEMDYTSDYDKYSKDWIAQIKNKLASVGVDVNSPEAEDYAEAAAELVSGDDNHDVDYWWQETQSDPTFMDEVDALPHIDASTSITSAREDDATYDDRFIHTLMGDIESEVSGEVDGLTFDTLENALNVTVVHGGEVTQFTVPHEDLSFDFDTMSDDVDYIVKTIRETLDSDPISSASNLDDDDNAITEAEHDEIANTIWDILDHARNVLDSKYDLQDIAEYESREVGRKGNKYTCTLWLSHLTHDYTIDVCWTNDNGSLILDKSVEDYGQEIVDIYLEEYGYQEGNVNSATNTCGIACKPEVLSSVTGDVIHGLTWSGLIQELSERGYEVDAAYRRSPDQWIVAYKDGKSYDIEVTRYSEGDYEVHPDNISEVIEADTDVYENDDINDDALVGFSEIATKSVPDSDGFSTDYTMYLDTNTGEYVFVFGDKDVYSPADGNFDWQCETEEEAWEWFNSYNGFEDAQVVSSTSVDATHSSKSASSWKIKYNDGAIQRCQRPDRVRRVTGTWENVLEEMQNMLVDLPHKYYNEDEDTYDCSIEEFVESYEDNADFSGSTVILSIDRDEERVFEISEWDD